MDIDVSIGVAMAGPEHLTPDLLIRDADLAMYRAKERGGGRFEIFDKHLETHITSQQERERELRRVLEMREFEIWYEPIHRLTTGKIEAYEAQLRWRRADGSVESFAEMLALAEDTGLSITLGRETLETVCRQLRLWTEGVEQPDLTMNINLTRRQFYHPDMVAQLKRALETTGANPAWLMLEISESTLIEEPDAAVAILQRMVDLNVRVAVDDFGSGLAPLNHLVRLPIDVLKMDAKLSVAATTTGRQLALVQALMQLGHTMGVQVVAQGIDTREQLEAFCRMGCELGQGRFLSNPLEPPQAQAGRNSWALIQGS
jgi:EAL domain-containing protein (putative c-di-GMP-specific phosphodiesterase class I)